MNKKLYLPLFFLIAIFKLQAQRFTTTPSGEKVFRILSKTTGKKLLTCSNKRIHYAAFGNIFIAPDGTEIVNAVSKVNSINDVFVMLNNHDVYRLIKVGPSNPLVSSGWITVKLGNLPVSVFETPKELMGDHLYAMTSKYVYVSRDTANYQTWTIDTAGLSNALPASISMDSSQTVWLATSTGLFTQALTSNTWFKNATYPRSFATKVFVDVLQRKWVAQTNFLHVSTTNGLTWTPAPTGLTSFNIVDIGDDVYGNIYVIQGNSDGSNLYFSAGGIAPFVRRDNTIKPHFVNFGTSVTYHSISGDTAINLATIAGAYSSTNQGQSWTLDSAVRAEKGFSIASTSDNRLVLTTGVGTFRRENDSTWKKLHPAGNVHLSGMQVFSDTTGVLYLAAENAYLNNASNAFPMVYKSTDNGNTLVTDTLGSRALNVGGLNFYVDKAGVQHMAGIVFVTGQGNFRRIWKKHPGQPWALDTAGLPVMNSSYSGGNFSEDESRNVYALITFNNITTIYKRALNSSAWSSTGSFNSSVYSLSANAGRLVAGTLDGVYYYNGSAWLPATKPPSIPSPIDVSSPAVYVAPDGAVWAYFEGLTASFASIGRNIWHTANLTHWTPAQPDVDTTIFASLTGLGDSVFALSANYDGISVLKRNAGELCAGGGTALYSNLAGNAYQWQVNTGSGFNNISNNNNYGGSNLRRLSLNNIPSAWYGYQYRCVVEGVNSNVFTLQLKNYWLGPSGSSWTTAANWSRGTVPDGNTDVEINNGIVTVNSNVSCRSIAVNAGARVNVNPGFMLTVTH